MFLKDDNGNLNGVIYEFSSLQHILKKMPKTPQGTAELLLNLKYAQYAKAGYTTIDALGPVNIADYTLDFMSSLSRNPDVQVRSFVYAMKTVFDSGLPVGYTTTNTGWSNFLSMFFVFANTSGSIFNHLVGYITLFISNISMVSITLSYIIFLS